MKSGPRRVREILEGGAGPRDSPLVVEGYADPSEGRTAYRLSYDLAGIV